MKGYHSVVISCTLSATQLGTGVLPNDAVDARAALSSLFRALLTSFATSLRTILRPMVKAEISIEALVSVVDSILCKEEGGDAGTGVAVFAPKREANGLVIRPTDVLVVGIGRPPGRGGRGGFANGARGGR